MKAIVLSRFGSIDNLELKKIDAPEAAENEVLVKVVHAAVNPYDWKVIELFGKEHGIELPVIPGSEIAGVVAAVGAAVTRFQKGDAVCGNLGKFGGCYADFVPAQQNWLAKKPEVLSFETAAAVPVAALTAWKALFEGGELKAGQKVLIHGASGNVGALAVQLAKAAGASVIATASGKNEQRVKALGADTFIDYTRQDFGGLVKDVDLVLDTIGGKTQEDSFKVLKPGGYLVSIIEEPSQEKAAEHGVHARVIYSGPNAERLEKILQQVADGILKITIDESFPLKDAARALKKIKEGHSAGKILLTP